LALPALTALQLESRVIGSVAVLASLSPIRQISQTPGKVTAAQTAMRGVLTTQQALSRESSVGKCVDGVYIGKTQEVMRR
jgi:hypothetical protein